MSTLPSCRYIIFLCAVFFATLTSFAKEGGPTRLLDLQSLRLVGPLKDDLKNSDFIDQEKRDVLMKKNSLSLADYEKQRSSKIFSSDQRDILVLGAVFLCNPYCQYLSLLTSPGYLIEIPEKASLQELRFIKKDSPQFRALFSDEQLQVMEAEAKVSQARMRQELSGKLVLQSEDESERRWLYQDFSIGLNGSFANLNSNSQFQSGLESSPYLGYLLRWDLVPNIQQKFFESILVPEFYYELSQSFGRKSKVSNVDISTSSSEYGLGLQVPSSPSMFAIYFFQKQFANSFSAQDITNSDERYQISGLGFRFSFKDYWLSFKKSLYISANDSQSYRAPPYSPNNFSIKIERCSGKIFFKWFEANYCGDLEYDSFTQRSGIAGNLSPSISEFYVVENNIRLNMRMIFGDGVRRRIEP